MKIKQLINVFFVFAVCQMNCLLASKTALVSNFGDSNVTLFDTTTDTPLTNVSTGSGPVGSAITPNGEKAYVANNDNTVTVINLTTTPPTTTTLNDSSFQFNGLQTIAITPDGSRAYFVNFLGNSVTVINTADDTLNAVISGLFIAPVGIAITPDGNTALVANINNVTKIDLATNALTLITSPDFNNCEDIAVRPDGSTAYVTNFVNGKIVPIDLATFVPGTAIDTFSTNFFIAINPSGTKAYITTFAANVPVIDLVHNTLSNNIVGLGATSGVAFTPDGGKAYVTDFGSTNVYPIQVQNDSPQPAITGFLSPSFVVVIPDQAPTANFTFTAGPPGSLTIFDASASSSPDGFIENYAWDFGDGHTIITSSPIISHVYNTSGSFTVSLTVTNSQGTSTFQTFTGQTVSNNGGPTAETSHQVDISSLPTVIKVRPNCGPTIGNNKVKIKGTNFINVTAVKFGQTNALSFKVNSPTSITAIVPPGAVGRVDVRVITLAGTSPITVNDQYTYKNHINKAPFPPSTFIGKVEHSKHLGKTKCVLKSKWDASPSKKVDFYRIYKNGIVVKEVRATSPLVFEKCLPDCCGKGFKIAAVNSFDLESCHLKIRIVHK